MKIFSVLVCLFAFANANAFSRAEGRDGLGFVAPTISDKANVYSPTAGEIIYDESDSTFYGRNHSSNWVALGGTAAGNAVSSAGSGYRIESAYITNGGTATVVRESGDWVNNGSTSRTAAGYVTVAINNGIFSVAPNCVCVSDQNYQCSMNSNTSTSAVNIITATDSTAQDTTFHLICMGPM